MYMFTVTWKTKHEGMIISKIEKYHLCTLLTITNNCFVKYRYMKASLSNCIPSVVIPGQEISLAAYKKGPLWSSNHSVSVSVRCRQVFYSSEGKAS